MDVRIDVLRLCFCLFVVIALLCGSGCGMVSTKEEQQMEERATMNELERKLMKANWGEEIESEENLYDYQREQLDQLRAAIQYLEDKYPGHELELYSFAPETTLTERGTLCFRSESGREHQLVLHVEENGYSCADTYYGELIEPAYDAALKEVIQDECGIDLLVLTTFAMPVGMEVNGETTVSELLALGSQLERKTHLFMQHPENKEETSAQLQKALNDAGFCGSYFVFFVDETDWGQSVLQLDQKRGTFERSYQNAFIAYSGAYKEAVTMSAEALVADGDFIGAIQKIGEGSATIGEDAELTEKAAAYENLYVDNVISAVDELIASKEFEKATAELSAAMEILPNNQKLLVEKDNLDNSKPQSLLSACPPYESRGWSVETVKMGGQTYLNTIELGGYYFDGVGPYAYFNLDGRYNTLEFDAGHIDESNMGSIVLEIVLDGVTSQNIEISSQDLPKHYVVPLNGAKQMIICLSSTYGKWGMVNAMLYPHGHEESAPPQLNSTGLLYLTCPPYEERGWSLETVKMGSQTYINAYKLNGYYFDGVGAYAYFNLDGKYDTLEFDMGHIDESNMSDIVLEIVLDGVISQSIELYAQDLPKHYVVPLNGARQMIISISRTYGAWGIANAVIQ